MRYTLLLGLLACPALAAPVPLPSRAADRATFEAASAEQAAATAARVTGPAFLERVVRAAPALGVKLPGTAAERRPWLAKRLKAEPAGDNRVRVRVVGCESDQARALRDAVVQVLTSPITQAERLLMVNLQAELMLPEQPVAARRVALRGLVVGGAVARVRFMADNEDPELQKLFQSVEAELSAAPLRKLP